MIEFILNNQDFTTDLPSGMTVLDFVRYRQNLKGTKIGCREGDCGACTILVGELVDDRVRYRSMTSCLMPLANAAGKHIVTIEGINPADGSLTPVQQAMVDENGTQCGFCTVGFVMSLTGHCVSSQSVSSPHVSKGSTSPFDAAISAIDGNICRCTGYKSIERAARLLSEPPASAGGRKGGTDSSYVPPYFSDIPSRLKSLGTSTLPVVQQTGRPLTQAVPTFVGGGTDTYVQKPEYFADNESKHLFYNNDLRGIRDLGDYIEIGASTTVTDLLESPVMNAIFPDLYKHLKLISSTPIRNMATLAGNFVNASPIGDMTVWFLALDASVLISGGNASVNERASRAPEGTLPDGRVSAREMPLADFYLGYKHLAKSEDEIVTAIRFKKPFGDFRFNFEKVCKRTYLDIASVNTAIALKLYDAGPPVPSVLLSEIEATKPRIQTGHVSAGGVAPVPLYLRKTSAFLIDKEISEETIDLAAEIIQEEISPISDVRGSEDYKRLLLGQLFRAHFVELFDKL
ncbi:MAG TPA: FAD binding domain-containing protein [Pyrinomonadaceae bacterium]|nr:FAD binding domain-containing protein [Pyrinomonadaceae bacterium]